MSSRPIPPLAGGYQELAGGRFGGAGVVQGQDGDAAGGIANGGVAQLPAGPAHRASPAVEERWRWRKAAALLRPQLAASARVRAVQAWPSGRSCS